MSGRGAFVVGIDLGTSNTVVAWADLAASDDAIHLFDVEQRVSRSETASATLFPSAAFALVDGDVADASLPGEKDGWTLGAYARKRGVEVPSRLVASAKSWLCHPSVEKVAPILPWGEDGVPKMSPFDATARYLEHVRHAWNAAHPDARLEHQHVVLTVPASFNEVARDLTVRAAKKAGLSVRLLEEPQAAFYSALRPPAGQPSALADHEGDAMALVADVGGGTTDLSLIRIAGPKGALTLERVAVGSHLLLGGDNMDLALAHALEPRLLGRAAADGQRLEPKLFAELVVQCKEAKEMLLAEGGPDEIPIAIAKRGSSLLGSVMRAALTKEETERLVFDGFFPKVARDDRPQRARSALVGFGLPYERDPGITRHVAAFLGRHLPTGDVDYVLFNGGVFRGASTRDRFTEIVGGWQSRAPKVMGHADPDRAVARGAAVFGLSLLGRGPRIEGGSARAYFIGVGRDAAGKDAAVCVLAKGAEEGKRARLEGRTFKLLVGREVRFDLLSSDTAIATRAGDVVDVTDDLERLPALATKIASSSASEVDVQIEAELTAVGTLEVACVRAMEDGESRRYQLAFDLNRDADPEAQHGPGGPRSMGPRSLPPRSIRPPGAGVDLVQKAFSKDDPRDVKSLLRDLEKALGERPTWTLDASRSLADALLVNPKARRATPEHERVWLLLAGYCLRPGFGAPQDAERLARFVPLFAERVAFPKEARSWQQFFVAFRRVAGGIIEATQLKIRDELDGFVAPSDAQGVKKPKGAKPEAKDDLLDLLSHLERVPRESRADLGAWLLERTWTDRDPRIWAAIGRIGARVPAYASVHHVVSIPTVEKWIDHLLREKWPGLPTAARAASELARRTDDRSRDVSESVREEVAKRLEKEATDPRFARVVREFVPIGDDDRVAAFGEALPVGLRLA